MVSRTLRLRLEICIGYSQVLQGKDELLSKAFGWIVRHRPLGGYE